MKKKLRGLFDPKGKQDRTPAGKRIKLRSKPLFVNLEDQFNLPVGTPRGSKWWNLFDDGINNSGLALFLSCRHQFYLRYVCGYDVPAYADAIEFGNVFHWLIERWHKWELPAGAELDFLKTIYHPEFLKSQVGLTPANKATQEGFYHLAAVMFPFYRKKYEADLQRPNVKVEQEFKVKHKLDDGTSINLYGTVDLQWGKKSLTILDHKTSSWITPSETESALTLNLQLLFYAHALKIKTGKDVEAVYHDVIRRTTAKKTQKETFKSYAKRIRKDLQSRPDYYFVRIPAEVGPKKLEAYRSFVLRPIIEDLAAWARGTTPHYPNPNALVGRYGPCRLFGPITSGNFGGLKRKRPTTRGVEI